MLSSAMSNENVINTVISRASDKLLKSSEASQPATTDIEESDPFDLSGELAFLLALCPPQKPTEEPSSASQSNEGIEDTSISIDEIVDRKKPTSIDGNLVRRENYRHPLHWQVAIVNKSSDKHDIYHGHTHDMSLNKVGILLERNISFASEVVILLSIPVMYPGQKKTIIEIDCSAKYTLLDSDHNQFRLEMEFIHFKGDGKRILSDILLKRYIPKEGFTPYY
jgi:hypothetical protein